MLANFTAALARELMLLPAPVLLQHPQCIWSHQSTESPLAALLRCAGWSRVLLLAASLRWQQCSFTLILALLQLGWRAAAVWGCVSVGQPATAGRCAACRGSPACIASSFPCRPTCVTKCGQGLRCCVFLAAQAGWRWRRCKLHLQQCGRRDRKQRQVRSRTCLLGMGAAAELRRTLLPT